MLLSDPVSPMKREEEEEEEEEGGHTSTTNNYVPAVPPCPEFPLPDIKWENKDAK